MEYPCCVVIMELIMTHQSNAFGITQEQDAKVQAIAGETSRYVNVTEAALSLSHTSYVGTVESACTVEADRIMSTGETRKKP